MAKLPVDHGGGGGGISIKLVVFTDLDFVIKDITAAISPLDYRG